MKRVAALVLLWAGVAHGAACVGSGSQEPTLGLCRPACSSANWCADMNQNLTDIGSKFTSTGGAGGHKHDGTAGNGPLLVIGPTSIDQTADYLWTGINSWSRPYLALAGGYLSAGEFAVTDTPASSFSGVVAGIHAVATLASTGNVTTSGQVIGADVTTLLTADDWQQGDVFGERVLISNVGGGLISNAYGLHVSLNDTGGGVQVGTELFLANMNPSITTRYGIYQQGNATRNIFNGSVEVGKYFSLGGGVHTGGHFCGTASLDYGVTAASTCDDLTMTVTDSLPGSTDTCDLAVPPVLASVANTSFSCFVSALNVVTVRRCNVSVSSTADPAAATIRACVWQH